MGSELPRNTARLCLLCIVVSACGVAHSDDVAKTAERNAADIVPPASDAPLSVYPADPNHLWNRLFSTLYIRPRDLPAKDEEPATIRF